MSLADGHIIRRLPEAKGDITSLAASNDGKKLFYSAESAVWEIPVSGGKPRKICDGDSVTADPDGESLIVQINAWDGVRHVRVPLSGAPGKPVPWLGAGSLTPTPLGPASVRAGKMVLTTGSRDSWFWKIGILDLTTGRVTGVPVRYEGDLALASWTSDGNIVAIGLPFRANIWRLRPAGVR